MGQITVNAAIKTPEHRVGAKDVFAVDVADIAQEIERKTALEPFDHRNHGQIRSKNVLPGRDELRLGAGVIEHVKGGTQKCRAINLAVLVGNFDALDVGHDRQRIGDAAFGGHGFECEEKIKAQQHVADV